ncbi:neuronal acetylcholine receptor subunit alpha-10-like [Saccoglossus kowalevskii]|uniref:Neuronal acetylcholine receptor subunit alpha-9-I-like n=1 Tax=Saccoglossus kowalevskii TaxID=10224 RepID=A0ABM0LWL7_SACKO|nr:PREDICTED: neuronal acetylcholine receptor subunit alpha-9-I-like [Saccoglossus kowalevskii]
MYVGCGKDELSQFVADLVEKLLGDYPKYSVRPVRNDSDVITLTHRMTPIQLIDMDEKNQVIKLKCWLEQSWVDVHMQWESELYGGADVIQISIEHIWQPDIVLYGSVKDEFDRHYDTDVVIYSNGTIKALQPYLIIAECAIDATMFPFDEQKCVFRFASWSYSSRYIDIVKSDDSNIDRFVSNGEWELKEMPVENNSTVYVCCEDPFPYVEYTLHLKRRSTFYVVNIILPSFLASVLISVGFYLPSDSGERVSLCVISILSQFVFLTVVSDYMPPTSQVIPYLQAYFLILIGMAVISAFVTAYTLNLHFPGPACAEVPEYMKKYVVKFLAYISCTQVRIHYMFRRSVFEMRPMRINDMNHHAGAKDANQVTGLMSGQVEADETIRSESFDGVSQERRLREWREVARLIDRAFLIVYTILLLSLLTGFLSFLAIRGSGWHTEENNDGDH